MLELIKRQMIDASQDRLFSEIEISPLGDLEDSGELEVEFTE
jgi:chromatin segregation and condensation protein Rec8/ScpA/Scc1 (kleisin family)